jgi:hypothetical protein
MSQRWPFVPVQSRRIARSLFGVGMVGLLVACTAEAAHAQEPAAAPPQSPYIGAEACKTCHADIYDSWSKTKHARATNRVRDEDRETGKCMGCHATGTPEQIAQERLKPSLPGVQCECCHGPARAHATPEAGKAPAMTGLNRHPQTEICERCHNTQSPHFQGFVFRAMAALVHTKGK